jgi:hypothetical protein
VQSALFISVQAGIASEFAAIAASVLYLTQPIGNVAGLAVASAVLQGTLEHELDGRLQKLGYKGKKKSRIVAKAVSDLQYIKKAKPLIVKAVVGSYVVALTWTHGKSIKSHTNTTLTKTVLSLACALTAFVGSFLLRQHKLR